MATEQVPCEAEHLTGHRRAVVIGGSLAGLLAARVLADHADSVTVIERDRFPQGPESRGGVPQDRHTHVMLESGQQALETLLPGITEEMVKEGSPRVGLPNDLVGWQNGYWYRRTAATSHILTGTRPLTEWVVRRRVLADTRIRVLEHTEVTGLLGDAARVRGVRIRERGQGAAGRDGVALEAELVVDASGRASHAAQWLAALGAEPPRQETLDTGLAYATRLYRQRPDAPEFPYGGILPNPQQIRTGLLLPAEGGLWTVLLSGLRGSEPPTDHAGFEAFVELLPHPVLREWLRTAEPVSPVHGFRNTANIRRRYDLPGRRPAGFLATGESLCSFNPTYGQGMSVAALSALALREALSGADGTPTTLRVQRALSGAARQAWDIATGADRKMPGARGTALRSSPLAGPVDWYFARVQRRACGDPLVATAFRQVTALTAPTGSLFAPPIARAVLFGPEPPAPSEPPTRLE
ncbi:NAD(P)/FAD-dependent oxidoreductase [Streptomyces sp. NPDC052396]|uniref:NAD(P)/FAD-dependent oxidoreductase n=1 Tax=Streptomyces sp. NPDC052396 TaxID=3365689 RepID=UPI0037D94642